MPESPGDENLVGAFPVSLLLSALCPENEKRPLAVHVLNKVLLGRHHPIAGHSKRTATRPWVVRMISLDEIDGIDETPCILLRCECELVLTPIRILDVTQP